MIAIVADTPYQLISAVLVAEREAPEEQIVFFVNTYLYFKEQEFHYSDAHPRIRKILYYGKKHMGAGKLLAGLANPAAMLKHIPGWERGMDFSAIISSRTTYMATFLYDQCAKRGRAVPLYLVEEGIGEYTSNMIHTRFTKACAWLGKKTHMDHVTKAYFSAPELYSYTPPFPVEKIPPVTPGARQLIETMFNMGGLVSGGNPLNGYHTIFLSEPNSCGMTNPADAAAYDTEEERIIDAVARAAGFSDIVIKVHPLDPFYKKEGVEAYCTQLPMESLLFSLHWQNKVFVSSTSTAMLTPKLLFGMEPYLIFTYKLLDSHLKKFLTEDAQRRRYYDFIHGVAGLYADQSRCAFPETVEELQTVAADFAARARAEA